MANEKSTSEDDNPHHTYYTKLKNLGKWSIEAVIADRVVGTIDNSISFVKSINTHLSGQDTDDSSGEGGQKSRDNIDNDKKSGFDLEDECNFELHYLTRVFIWAKDLDEETWLSLDDVTRRYRESLWSAPDEDDEQIPFERAKNMMEEDLLLLGNNNFVDMRLVREGMYFRLTKKGQKWDQKVWKSTSFSPE